MDKDERQENERKEQKALNMPFQHDPILCLLQALTELNNWRDLDRINSLYDYKIDPMMHTGYSNALLKLFDVIVDHIYLHIKTGEVPK